MQFGHGDKRGDKGLALTHRNISGMGFVWNAPLLEAHIDFVKEFRDAASSDVSNFVSQVKSKSWHHWSSAIIIV